MIYLASPYSHRLKRVREYRFQAACRAAAILMQNGLNIFSPIAHTHPISVHGLPGDWQYWRKYDEEHIRFCEALYVLMIPGWKESKGIREEIKLAAKLKKDIFYLEFRDPETLVSHFGLFIFRKINKCR
jgi:hypothetical protein